MLFTAPDIPLSCMNAAAKEYHVPAKLLVAVLNVEQGKVGMAIKNQNHTYDLGPFQINSTWENQLEQQGISLQQVRDNACLNAKVGAWILSKSIADSQDLLQGIGDYHSHTPSLNTQYVQKIRLRYTEISNYLDS